MYEKRLKIPHCHTYCTFCILLHALKWFYTVEFKKWELFYGIPYLWNLLRLFVNHLHQKNKQKKNTEEEQPRSQHHDNAISSIMFDIYQRLWDGAVINASDQIQLSFCTAATSKAHNRHQHIWRCFPPNGSWLITFLWSRTECRGGKIECVGLHQQCMVVDWLSI